MIRAIRPNAAAQDDASMVTGWNISPNVAYTLSLVPGAASCAVLLYDEAGTTLVASGGALVGIDQPCVLRPQTGQTVGMVDADLGWHLLLTTIGTESPRTIRISPMVDLPDEIHPVYGDDDMATARATEAINVGTHYLDDVTVSCPLGLGASLGDVVSVPVDGETITGQVESISWVGTSDGATETAVIRRHVAIAPEAFVEPIPPTPPTLVADTAATDSETETSGNVLDNDDAGLTVVAVNGLSGNVGSAVAGSSGGLFTIAADGSWSFDPNGDFDSIEEDTETAVTYYASDGTAEASTTLTVTVTPASQEELWTPAYITTAQWLDASDTETVTTSGSTPTEIADKSGNGRNATGNSTGTYVADSQNGLHAVHLADSSFLSSFSLPAGDFSFFFSIAPATASAAGTLRYLQDTQTGRLILAQLCDAADPRTHVGYYDGAWKYIAAAESGAQILNFDLQSAGAVIYRDGVSIGSGAYSQTAIGGTTRLFCGYTGGANFADGKFFERILIQGAVDTATRQKIEGYLAHKWGLAASLPTDHPYKTAAPTV